MTSSSRPRLHLVGGFLGSGKTTAISTAAKLLAAQGQRVGILTNDQGRYLVDTAFVRAQDIPAMEVVGGCICVQLVDFIGRLDLLIEKAHPQVIFAESVGSCADMVATVVKPLMSSPECAADIASLSVFTDARLLLRHLEGQELPFSEPVAYLFGQQLEEAGLIVVNKIDLVSPADRERLSALLKQHYHAKRVSMQNSLEAAQVADWLDAIESGHAAAPLQALDLDLSLRAQGVMRLGWLSARLDIMGGDNAARFIADLFTALRMEKIPIGHAKALLTNAARQTVKISLTGADETPEANGLLSQCVGLGAGWLDVLINLRAESPPQHLRALLDQALLHARERNPQVNLAAVEAFYPEAPRPTEHGF